MKIGFIGLGRMGSAMAQRLIDGGHDLGVYNRSPEKAKPLETAGAKLMGSIGEAAAYGPAVYSMLADDAALENVALQSGGLLETLPKGGIHICAGTHGIAVMRKIQEAHGARGQKMIAAPILGRPEMVQNSQATTVVSGPPDALATCKPLFEAIAKHAVEAGVTVEGATAIKIANNFLLGCAIEAVGESMSLVRKYDVPPETFYNVITNGMFSSAAYTVYGKIIIDEAYSTVGQMATLGLKDANLALAAGEVVGVPLPSGNVWRDRLVGAVAHGDGDKDWAVMAKEQARASGLE